MELILLYFISFRQWSPGLLIGLIEKKKNAFQSLEWIFLSGFFFLAEVSEIKYGVLPSLCYIA